MLAEQVHTELIRRLLPPRRQDTHKGHYGRAMLICGALGYSGAAFFSAESAVRSGAGLVDLTVPAAIFQTVAVKLNEAMVYPLPDTPDGMFDDGAIPILLKRMECADAILIGCGLGRSEPVSRLVQSVVTHAKVPVVVDADGINALAAHKNILRDVHTHLILTPHDGELTRFLGEAPVRPGESRTDAAARLATTLGVTLVMKGHETVTADASGKTRINTTGNAGMAKGGSGDVLAGMITALAAQGLCPFDAASAAVYLHGLAGDLAQRSSGEIGMTPTDMLRLIPQAFYQCRGV